ncbi:hypothetical protein [Flammeovirga sp. SJP92]|uniref:hypothetical protein n=1 Tax=Flammeovirga sp. SJP92 TaxID=1775430 RepID=UPI00078765CD|nr:hypothetical protein [Flammeovirga sp. SJP92]KXX68033.1 hypothetical protein AVL50_24600 [Flammeovirga sp. SJP92]
MKEFYKRKFKNKSRFELELIVDNASYYHPEAVLVAKSLILLKENESKQDDKENLGEDLDIIEQSINDLLLFLKTYRINYFLNYIVSIQIVYSAFLFLKFYEEELGLDPVNDFTFFWIGLLINHILYIIETKKIYTFLSRVINDLFFLNIIFVFLKIIGGINISSIEDAAVTIFIIVVIIVFIEIIFSITFTFTKFLWQQLQKLK